MWTKTYEFTTKEVTKEQMWKLFSDVNNWHTWDKGIEFAKMTGNFEKGNFFTLRPNGGPKVKIELIETIPNQKFVDFTKFPLAKMVGEHLLEETKEGLKIKTTMTVTGILAFFWIKIVAQGIVDGLPADTQNQIKAAKSL